jgi:hypothetical protein
MLISNFHRVLIIQQKEQIEYTITRTIVCIKTEIKKNYFSYIYEKQILQNKVDDVFLIEHVLNPD